MNQRLDLVSPGTEVEQLRLAIQLQRLESLVKDAYIEDLKGQIHELRRERVVAVSMVETRAAGERRELEVRLRKVTQELHDVWSQKNGEIEHLKQLMQRRGVAPNIEQLAEAVGREREVLEAYIEDLRLRTGQTQAPTEDSARLAISRAWRLTIGAIRRRLRF